MKRGQYYAILLDCTKGSGHVVKIAMMLRNAAMEKGCTEEHFVLLFAAVEEIIASVLMNVYFFKEI